MTGTSGSEGMRSIRSAAAHDGRAASARIDRVEAQQRWALQVVAEALGPEALRGKLGQERALEFLRVAGWDAHRVEQIGDQWEQDRRERERSVSQQTVRRYGDGYEGDPAHDQRITDAIMAGVSGEQLRQVMITVGQDYRQEAARKAEAQRRTQDVLWQGRDGRPVVASSTAVPLGISADPHGGGPRQRSTTHRSVPELGSEPVGETPMGDVRPVPVICTEHVARQGDKFCPVCGKPRPQPHQEEAAS
jgi:hypothetical protein